MELTVLSYNIWAGGEGRLDKVARVIAAERPDVAALIEVTPESADKLGEAFGASVVVGEGNADYHVAWLSRACEDAPTGRGRVARRVDPPIRRASRLEPRGA